MRFATKLTARLGLAHPIIQAPMAGGGATPELVSAVSNVGALGFIGAAYLTPAQILDAARSVRAGASGPFGINLFAPVPAPDREADAGPALARMASFHAELGLPPPTAPAPAGDAFDARFAAVLDSGAPVFSFTFGIPPAAAIEAARSRGVVVIGTATTVAEAVMLERAGVDAVVAQGSEAGAHRGTFAAEFEASMVGTMALVPQVVDAVRVPVIASGGIMDGRGIVAALALGADAVQMGTAFLTCDEAGIPEVHKSAILAEEEHRTRVTRAFSGRPARGIVNRFMTEMEDAALPYPLQNALTRPMRTAAAGQGRADMLSLWAGQGLRMARRQGAAELVARLAREAEEAAGRFQ